MPLFFSKLFSLLLAQEMGTVYNKALCKETSGSQLVTVIVKSPLRYTVKPVYSGHHRNKISHLIKEMATLSRLLCTQLAM